jgi:hypothetical protein
VTKAECSKPHERFFTTIPYVHYLGIGWISLPTHPGTLSSTYPVSNNPKPSYPKWSAPQLYTSEHCSGVGGWFTFWSIAFDEDLDFVFSRPVKPEAVDLAFYVN